MMRMTCTAAITSPREAVQMRHSASEAEVPYAKLATRMQEAVAGLDILHQHERRSVEGLVTVFEWNSDI